MNKEVEVIIIIIIRLFQKVDQWMNKDEQMDSEARKKLDDANQVDYDDDDDNDDDDDDGLPAHSHKIYSHQVGICHNDKGWEYDTVTFLPMAMVGYHV